MRSSGSLAAVRPSGPPDDPSRPTGSLLDDSLGALRPRQRLPLRPMRDALRLRAHRRQRQLHQPQTRTRRATRQPGSPRAISERELDSAAASGSPSRDCLLLAPRRSEAAFPFPWNWDALRRAGAPAASTRAGASRRLIPESRPGLSVRPRPPVRSRSSSSVSSDSRGAGPRTWSNSAAWATNAGRWRRW